VTAKSLLEDPRLAEDTWLVEPVPSVVADPAPTRPARAAVDVRAGIGSAAEAR
jgi:hypothetical protein